MSFASAFPDLAGELPVLLLRATLLMALSWAAAAALRSGGASAATRHIAWLLGIAALLALPVLCFLVPAVGLPILPAEGAAPAAASASPTVTAAPMGAASVFADTPFQRVWFTLLVAMYALGASVLLARLLVGRRTLQRLWSDAGRGLDPDWEKLLSGLSAGMGLTRPVELRISHGPAVPMTWGTLAPKVLLPAEASQWPPERRRLVLLHELAHVARRDSLSRSLASLVCALYWFHPGAWFAARRMRMEQELAADDRVLVAGGSAQAYAHSLLHLARGAGAGPWPDQAAAMAGMHQLERRLVSITSPARRDRPGAFFLSSSALLGGCTTLLVAVAVPVGATSRLPRSFEVGRADPAATAGTAPQSRQTGKLSPRAGQAAPADHGEGTPSLASNVDPASRSPSEGSGSEAGEVAVGTRSAPVETEPAGEESRAAQTLPHYGWELPRRDSRVGADASEDPARLARLTVPAPRNSGSGDRTGRPRWARNIPRIVQGPKPMNSPAPVTQGPLMLSWPLGGEGK